MANNDSMYGLRWQKEIGGGSTAQPIECFVATGYQAAPGAVNCDLRPGDPVKRVSDGSVNLCAAAEAPFGVIMAIGPYYDSLTGTMTVGGPSLPGGTAWGTVTNRRSRVYVIPVANQTFEIDCDDNVTATTEATYMTYEGENCEISLNPVAGSTLVNPRLDISLHAVTATLMWRIVGLSNRVGLDPSGTFFKLLVTANIAQQAPYTALGV